MYVYMTIYDVMLHSKEAIWGGETVSAKGGSFADTVWVDKVYFFAWYHLPFNNFCVSFYGLHNEGLDIVL